MSTENPQNYDGGNQGVIEILALVQLGKIKIKDLDENNQAIFGYYGHGGLRDEDREFDRLINARASQIVDRGERVPLYSPEVIKNVARHRRRSRGVTEHVSQLKLWDEAPSELSLIEDKSYFDKKLVKTGQDLDSRFHCNDNKIINEEISFKKSKLREMIGLPVAQGKDPHVNDDFYKYLVKYVCRFDIFWIFREYDRVITEIPEELESKIQAIKNLTDELLNGNLNRNERYARFKEFIDDHREEWSIVDYKEGQ